MNIIKKTKEHTTKLSISGKIKNATDSIVWLLLLRHLYLVLQLRHLRQMIRLWLLIICPDLFWINSCSRSYFAWLWCCSGGTFPEVP